jgi:circadian clock protein KaiB
LAAKKKQADSRKAKAPKKVPAALRGKKYQLCLYVAGASERSRRAVLRARELCETQLKGNYELHVIDVYQQPILARDGQILATPTLVRELPRPMRWLIGNLAHTAGLFVGMDMVTKPEAAK